MKKSELPHNQGWLLSTVPRRCPAAALPGVRKRVFRVQTNPPKTAFTSLMRPEPASRPPEQIARPIEPTRRPEFEVRLSKSLPPTRSSASRTLSSRQITFRTLLGRVTNDSATFPNYLIKPGRSRSLSKPVDAPKTPIDAPTSRSGRCEFPRSLHPAVRRIGASTWFQSTERCSD